tara:strand:- start:55 stop:696 length:642 start_codon:yes stop_codon:yes gene_type:complete
MTNIFSEVDEDIRKERYKNIWNKYGKYLIALIVLLVIAFSLNQFYQEKKLLANESLLEKYLLALESVEKKQIDFSIDNLKTVYTGENKMLSAFSGLKLSEIYFLSDNKDESLTVLSSLYLNDSLDQIYRELALYKFIMIDFNNISPSTIEKKIKSIKKDKLILEPYFQELIGIKYLLSKDIVKANLIFTNLILDENIPIDLIARLKKLIKISN